MRKLKYIPTIVSNYDISDNPTSKELIRLNLKEKFLKIILEESIDATRELDKLLDKNPDR